MAHTKKLAVFADRAGLVISTHQVRADNGRFDRFLNQARTIRDRTGLGDAKHRGI